MHSSEEPYEEDDSGADNLAKVPNFLGNLGNLADVPNFLKWLNCNDAPLSSSPDADTNADKSNIHNKKRYKGDGIGVGTATVSCANAPLSPSGPGSNVGVGDGDAVNTATDLCGSVLPPSPCSGSCAGVEDEIEVGGAGIPVAVSLPHPPHIMIIVILKIAILMWKPMKPLIMIHLQMTILWKLLTTFVAL